MPEEKQTDDIVKVLSDLKSIEPQGRPHRRSAPAEGRSEDGAGKSKKSHHKQAAAAPPRKIRIQKRGHPGSMPGGLALLAARFRPRHEPVGPASTGSSNVQIGKDHDYLAMVAARHVNMLVWESPEKVGIPESRRPSRMHITVAWLTFSIQAGGSSCLPSHTPLRRYR